MRPPIVPAALCVVLLLTRFELATGQESTGILFQKSDQAFEMTGTVQVALGDWDGDGDVDAVFANMGFHHAIVWINAGDGTLREGQQLTQQAHGVDAGDLDGDGDTDLFLTSAGYTQDGVEYNRPSKIYFNDGRGHFVDSGQNLGDRELSGTHVHLFDIELDGDLDALVGYYPDQDRLYVNDGRGRFSFEGRVMPEGAGPGDLDSDGDVDLLLWEQNTGFQVLLNDGSGAFRVSQLLADTTIVRAHVALGDVDRDGDPDAVVTNGTSALALPTRILVNDGTGHFAYSGQELPDAKSGRIALGDLNGDGSLDIVLTSWRERFYVLLNDGTGHFTDSGFVPEVNNANINPRLADLDGDGDLDIILPGFFEGPTEVWWNGSR
jgi:hypothetical protein